MIVLDPLGCELENNVFGILWLLKIRFHHGGPELLFCLQVFMDLGLSPYYDIGIAKILAGPDGESHIWVLLYLLYFARALVCGSDQSQIFLAHKGHVPHCGLSFVDCGNGSNDLTAHYFEDALF